MHLCYNQKDQHSGKVIEKHNNKRTSADRMVLQRKKKKKKVLTHLQRSRLAGKTPQGKDLLSKILPQGQSTLK